MANTIAALVAGRHRWLARLKAEGRPIPFGRKKGVPNRPPELRAAMQRQREGRRAVRDSRVRHNAERRARRVQRAQAEADTRLAQAEACVLNGLNPHGDAVALIERTLGDLLAAESSGVGSTAERHRLLNRTEAFFIDCLARGGISASAAERIYQELMRREQLRDRGESADRRRRGKLEEAYAQWLARVRNWQMIGHYIERAEARSAMPRADDWRPRSILPEPK